MSIASSSAVNSAVNQASPDNPASLLVLKKALNAQAQSAAQLIQAIPRPPAAASLPPNLGRNVNTTA